MKFRSTFSYKMYMINLCNLSQIYRDSALIRNNMELNIEYKVDRNSIRIVNLNSKENDFKYWLTQSIEKRLETLEELRTQFILWKYGTEQGFQRVYRIIERS